MRLRLRTATDCAMPPWHTPISMAPLIAAQSLRLAEAIKTTLGPRVWRVKSVANLLKEDADRPESLLDLSFPMEGGQVRILPPNKHAQLLAHV